jgi:ParB family chromosome partitioning protein
MDEKQQVAIMLMENMQRSDLTIIEEAEGMQMMFDLGSTADEIAEKTGLSKTTIKRRSQLLELDHEKLVQSYERGGTMQDYLRLQKIKDQEKRNQVLEKIGTNNFDYAVKQAIDEEKDEANKLVIIEMVEEFAQKIDHADHETMRYEKNYRYCIKEHQKPDDWESTNYYYLIGSYQIDLYTDRVDGQPGSYLNHQQSKIEEDRKKLSEIEHRMHSLRRAFVENYPQGKAKIHSGEIVSAYVMMKISRISHWFNENKFRDLMGLEKDVQKDTKKIIEESPEKAMLACFIVEVDSGNGSYSSYYNEHQSSEALDVIYDLLYKLGYEMSDEEIAIRNGTHELYAKEEEE